jgi:hypothetical protein
MLSLDKVIDLIAAFMRDEKIDVFAVEWATTTLTSSAMM